MNGAGVGDQDSASAPTTQYPLPCPYDSWLAQAPRTYLWNIWHPIVCRTPITSRLKMCSGNPMLGPEFAIVLTKEHDLDVLIVQVEALPEVSTERYGAIADQVEREIRSSCELRAVIEVIPQGTLPPTQFKAKRVRDLR